MKIIRRLIGLWCWCVLVIGAKRISGVLKIELPKWKKRRKRKKERKKKVLSLSRSRLDQWG